MFRKCIKSNSNQTLYHISNILEAVPEFLNIHARVQQKQNSCRTSEEHILSTSNHAGSIPLLLAQLSCAPFFSESLQEQCVNIFGETKKNMIWGSQISISTSHILRVPPYA